MAKRRYYWDRDGNLGYQEGWAVGLADWLGMFGGNTRNAGSSEDALDMYAEKTGTYINANVAPYLNQRTGLNLSEKQWQNIIADHYATQHDTTLGGSKWMSFDVDRFDADVQSLLDALANEPVKPLLQDYLTDARAQIDAENAAEFAEMDRLLGQQRDLYNAELEGLGASYDLARSNLLSQQYQQNSQLMDTLQSGMERSRRNALEAGASAGIRIADNINTLLSVQNKQSATSMETANQLSQMMINQRNAEAAARRDYSSYLQADNAQRSNLRLSANDRASSLADTNFTAAKDAYTAKQNEFESKYKLDNPMYDYRQQLYDANQKAKSKYSGGYE